MATRKTQAQAARSLLLEISKGSQDVVFQELVQVGADRLRIVIRSDSYRDQCFARVGRWDGAKWQEVWHLGPSEMNTADGLKYVARGVGLVDFAADRTALLDAAFKVLGVAGFRA